MGSIAGLPVTAWLPILAAAFIAPGVAAAAPPDGLSTAASRAAATTPGESRSIRVAYHDLDITTPEGIAALYVRIRRAAVDVCGAARPLTGTRVIRPETEACVRHAVVASVRQIGIPGLAALDAEQQVLGEEEAARPSCEAPVRAKIII
jgi:UrcA family protein